MSFQDQIIEIVAAEAFIEEPERLIIYECDALTLEKFIPRAVVRCCHAHGIPIVPRGAGTSLSGSVLAMEGAIVLCLSRLQSIVHIDPDNQRALIEAGCANAWITRAAQSNGLYYAPDPSSQYACMIGGNIATNSGGPYTLKHGVTTNHVLGLKYILPSGEANWLGC